MMNHNLHENEGITLTQKIRIGIFITGLFTMLLITAYPYTLTQLPRLITGLSGEWKISPDDNPSFSNPETDDSSWDTISLPGSLVRYMLSKKNKNRGVCWIRKTVTLDSTVNYENLGLILGRIGNADETYLNGHRVGDTGQIGTKPFSMWNFPRNYTIPKEYVAFNGKNVISVRIWIHGMGEILGNMGLTYEKAMKPYAENSRFIHVTMGYVAIAMGMVLFMIFIFFSTKLFEVDEYMYYSLQLAAGLPIVLEICNIWPVYPSQLFRVKLLAFAWAALNVLHPIFLHRFYDLERKFVERFLFFYLGIIIIFCLILTTEDTIRTYGTIFIIFTTGIGFYNLSCHFSALYRKSQYSKTFSFFGITVVLCAIHDGLAYLQKYSGFNISLFGYSPSVMVFHVGAIFLYIGTALVLFFKFMSVTEEVEALNENLENYIFENARLNQQLEDNSLKKKSSAISSIAEEKIKQAITFINENYSETELTREGLASQIGVHPDSFGRQFKMYTGKKLGDFIYEIRVNEAARRLREEDTNVIDIAFEVGFESIRTFNRIFPKFMNITPNKYRAMFRNGHSDYSS